MQVVKSIGSAKKREAYSEILEQIEAPQRANNVLVVVRYSNFRQSLYSIHIESNLIKARQPTRWGRLLDADGPMPR